jgi:hypothetical protein
MNAPRRWSEEELAADVVTAKSGFRRRRLEEPVQLWKDTFDRHRTQFEELFEKHRITEPGYLTAEVISQLLHTHLGEALRYLTAPPISEDDLKVLVDANSISRRALSTNPEIAARLAEVVARAFDPRRFPWIDQGRPPTPQEKEVAVVASAALIAAQRLATVRRIESKATQEAAVKENLKGLGLVEVRRRHIRNMSESLTMGQYCSECKIGDRKADIPVGLFDGRLMAIECKVSNSTLNSVKRINNDAAAKAVHWLRDFGPKNVVPAAVISGVFNVSNLLQAQEAGLALFWSHRLEDLGAFVFATRS